MWYGGNVEHIIKSSIIKEHGNTIYTEKEGHEGVSIVAEWLRRDMEGVFGCSPQTMGITAENLGDIVAGSFPILCISADKGNIARILSDTGVIDIDPILGKRECYIFTVADLNSVPVLIIAGSDKRGTIYGMLHLSELSGVSPFTDWLDIKPLRRDALILNEDHTYISKEPSVRYRGFFINDEWPAFGNWCNKRFGGFNAECYEHVFELLLRLKGNYMWPAMWSSIFPDDGPGMASAELADKLGVVMGMSHHEPCLRQGEEYKYVRGPESVYGDAWDFRKNKEGITRFWEDGLKRGGSLENVITVGMRGEFDSTVLGKEATLGDNIELLRDVLKTQNELIRKYVNEDLDRVPRLLALYKEVEAFYYGDDTYRGLKDDPELEGVTLMLCDDNFGNLRTLPLKSERDHKGGYGMYYHMDYHGWPVSYEWVNSSSLPKIWEQMTQCYEFGVKELWIVNVGDIFTNEYPLSFFMALAYDYEKWGASVPDAPSAYTEEFVRTQFPTSTDDDRRIIEELLAGYTRIAANRRPEAMNDRVYSPLWYGETDELLTKCDRYMDLTKKLYDRLSVMEDDHAAYTFYELVYYPLMADLNIQKLWLYTGLNHVYAGICAADEAHGYADRVRECLEFDRKLTDSLHTVHDGMWYGMGMSEHIGFKYWNEEECSYPVLHEVMRPVKPRIVTMIPGTDRYSAGGVWTSTDLVLDSFLRPDAETGRIALYSVGEGIAEYEITGDTDVFDLSDDDIRGNLKCGEHRDIVLRLKEDRRGVTQADSDNIQSCGGLSADHTVYELRIKAMSGTLPTETTVKIPVRIRPYEDIPSGTYIWCGTDSVALSSEHYDVITDEECAPMGYISIEAGGYCLKGTDGAGEFMEIRDYGKTVSGMKAFPVTETYTPGLDAPYLNYNLYMEDEGEYTIDVYVTPANPVYKDNLLRYGIKLIRSDRKAANDSRIRLIDTVSDSYAVGDDNDEWKKGVLDNIHISTSDHILCRGLNTVRIYACDPGFVLQKLVVYKKGRRPAASYLGPAPTYRIDKEHE